MKTRIRHTMTVGVAESVENNKNAHCNIDGIKIQRGRDKLYRMGQL